jgi:transglutaminase-like putative cysteine protease
LPLALSDSSQEVSILQQSLPADAKTARDQTGVNAVLYLEPPAGADGKIPLSITYHVRRAEIAELKTTAEEQPATFLRPDAKVPVGGKALALLNNRKLPDDQLQLARLLYDVVDDHMVYRKDKPGWGRGDAEWACDSGFGNCTDFHSLFICLARAQRIPAKFEMGFSIPAKHGQGDIAGYHCWAKFQPQGHGWIPVDISEASKNPAKRDYYFGHLDENRIGFTSGRDLVLEPRQGGPPLNFFIYPYVEVDRKPYPPEKVVCKFSYEDLDEPPVAPSK